MEKISGVYKIENKVNGKIYIGSSVNIIGRRRTHFSMLNRGVHANSYLQNSWNKYGEGVFIFKIIEKIPNKKKILEREQWYLDNFIRWGFDYNISKDVSAPRVGIKHTEDAIKKISISSSKRRHSQESKDKIAEAHRGEKGYWYGTKGYWHKKSRSEETKKKISKSLIGENHPMYGKRIVNKETLKRMALAKQGEKSPNSKLTESQVLKIRSLHGTGNYTQKELGKMFGVSSSAVQLIISRKRWKHI